MSKTALEVYEEEAKAQVGELKKFRTMKPRGTRAKAELLTRAKLASTFAGSYVRLRGTAANEESNRIAAAKVFGVKK